jgi:hypothetical protein
MKFSFSIFFIFPKLSFILVSALIHPDASPLSQTFHEVSLVGRTVFPKILAIAVRMAIFVHPFVLVSVGEVLHTLAVLHKLTEESYIKCFIP